jgi:hypothetical protein
MRPHVLQHDNDVITDDVTRVVGAVSSRRSAAGHVRGMQQSN